MTVATKTNEVAGTRAVLRHCRMSSYKAREVLDMIRGLDFQRATELSRTAIAQRRRSSRSWSVRLGPMPNTTRASTCRDVRRNGIRG